MSWWHLRCFKLASVLCLLALAAQAAPVVYSHRVHAPFALKCTLCHAGAKSAERAGFPGAAKCMLCHATLEKVRLKAESLSWKARPVLPDYVIFSHAVHKTGDVKCESCHGEVNRTDAPGPPSMAHMRHCLACHRQRKATLECYACHSERQ
jgi:cytochrome c3-like protein